MRRTWAFLLIAILALTLLCACGKATPNNAIQGTYSLFDPDADANQAASVGAKKTGNSYITLSPDGKAVLSIDGIVSEARWKADGEKFTVTTSDGKVEMSGSFSDGVLALESEGEDLIFIGDDVPAEKAEELVIAKTVGSTDRDFEKPESTEIDADAPATPLPALSEDPDTPTVAVTDIPVVWNGWYYGYIQVAEGSELIEDGQMYDAVMYVELNGFGNGRMSIYDLYGGYISNNHSNLCVQAACNADGYHIYCTSGFAMNGPLNPQDWIVTRGPDVADIACVSGEYTDESGKLVQYSFQFKPWNDRWEANAEAQNIPHFGEHIEAIDAGIDSPFGDDFPGFGIANSNNMSGSGT